ncbi:hypothetical protein FOZ60_015535 [Perkinsus olseni]|uniref:Uncharacterized protein n=1 Tax=Perkinsus olseni TaxID=32597 RepID=A0A7J6P5L8_PEROL|nr:hypothetical protein FOZ60_015535 [Perkinsus olseni]
MYFGLTLIFSILMPSDGLHSIRGLFSRRRKSSLPKEPEARCSLKYSAAGRNSYYLEFTDDKRDVRMFRRNEWRLMKTVQSLLGRSLDSSSKQPRNCKEAIYGYLSRRIGGKQVGSKSASLRRSMRVKTDESIVSVRELEKAKQGDNLFDFTTENAALERVLDTEFSAAQSESSDDWVEVKTTFDNTDCALNYEYRSDNLDEEGEPLYIHYTFEYDATRRQIKMISDGELNLYPTSKLELDGISEPLQEADHDLLDVCLKGMSEHLGFGFSLTESITDNHEWANGRKTLIALDNGEDRGVDGKLLIQWKEQLDRLYEDTREQISTDEEKGYGQRADFECSIRIKPIPMGASPEYAFYEMAITRDDFQNGYFTHHCHGSDCAMRPAVVTPLRLHSSNPSDNTASEEEVSQSCHSQLVDLVTRSVRYLDTGRRERTYRKLSLLVWKQIEMESRDGSWKAMGDQKEPRLHLVEKSSLTADILIENMYTSTPDIDDSIKLFRHLKDGSGLCRLTIEGENVLPEEGGSGRLRHTLQLSKKFRINKITTPRGSLYELRDIWRDIKNHFPDPAIHKGIDPSSTEMLCKTALYDYLLAAQRFTRAEGASNTESPALEILTSDDLELIKTKGVQEGCYEFTVENGTSLGEWFRQLGEIAEERKAEPDYQEAWNDDLIKKLTGETETPFQVTTDPAPQ